MKKLIFYTDLDGTFLDHHDYSWSAAQEAVDKLQATQHALVFNTSKTLPEVLQLQKQIGFTAPFCIENGGALWIPENYFIGHDDGLVCLGIDNKTILETIAPLRKIYNFRSFEDLSVDDVMELTGLDYESAELAKHRSCSEPLVWLDSDANLRRFMISVESLGLEFVKGGRFYHLSGKSDKGNAMNYLHDLYRQEYSGQELVSVALGDSENDLSMLSQADISVIIQRQDGSFLQSTGRDVRLSSAIGPLGWNQEVLKILASNNLKEKV